jgi:hypothetical protein
MHEGSSPSRDTKWAWHEQSEHGETTMDTNLLKSVASYLAIMLVNSGSVRPPTNEKEACDLLNACMRGFVNFLQKAGQLIEVNAQGSDALN